MRKLIIALVASLLCTSMAVTSGLASDFTLKIFGNANMDETIDEEDIEYVQGIIKGTNDETELADANYDGQIDEDDIAQIRLIIDGEEEQLTLIDMADRVVTVDMPVEKVVIADLLNGITKLVQLGAEDKIVGITDTTKAYGYGQLIDQKPNSWWTPLQSAAPELKDLPTVGTHINPNLEAIISLDPDVGFVFCSLGLDAPSSIQDKAGVPVICISNPSGSTATEFDSSSELFRLVGWVVGREKEAEELISYTNDKLEEITEITSEIPDDEKPKVYMAVGQQEYLTQTLTHYDPINLAGGINVAEGAETGSSVAASLSKEQIIAWNPDIILIHRVPTSESHVWGNNRETILADPDLQTINAVKDQRVYYTKGLAACWDPATGIVETFYLAKLFHPDKFGDSDVEVEGNEILKRFYGVDGLYTEIAERCELYTWG